jgi:hypothetical protein
MPFKTLAQRRAWQRNRSLTVRVSEASTLEAFLEAKGNCEECNRNPVVFITSENIPLCAAHWSLLANSEIEWEMPLTEQQLQALLADLTTHRRVLEGSKTTMVCLKGVWHVKA